MNRPNRRGFLLVVLESGLCSGQPGIDSGLGFSQMAFADGSSVEGIDIAAAR